MAAAGRRNSRLVLGEMRKVASAGLNGHDPIHALAWVIDLLRELEMGTISNHQLAENFYFWSGAEAFTATKLEDGRVRINWVDRYAKMWLKDASVAKEVIADSLDEALYKAMNQDAAETV